MRFLSNRDQLYKNAANVKPISGYEDVVCHAQTARRLAQCIRESGKYKGGPIRLIACQSGAWEFGAAQQRADEHGVNVMAPTETVSIKYDYITDDECGQYEEINTGKWKVYHPRR